jgi:hypothetical protein
MRTTATIPALFTTTAQPWIKRLVLQNGEVRLRHLAPEQALAYWKDGADWLHITAQGAKQLLGTLEPDARIPLLACCKTPLEVEAVLQCKPTTAPLRAAAKARATELQGSLPTEPEEPAAAAQPRKAERTVARMPAARSRQATPEAPAPDAEQPQG